MDTLNLNVLSKAHTFNAEASSKATSGNILNRATSNIVIDFFVEVLKFVASNPFLPSCVGNVVPETFRRHLTKDTKEALLKHSDAAMKAEIKPGDGGSSSLDVNGVIYTETESLKGNGKKVTITREGEPPVEIPGSCTLQDVKRTSRMMLEEDYWAQHPGASGINVNNYFYENYPIAPAALEIVKVVREIGDGEKPFKNLSVPDLLQVAASAPIRDGKMLIANARRYFLLEFVNEGVKVSQKNPDDRLLLYVSNENAPIAKGVSLAVFKEEIQSSQNEKFNTPAARDCLLY